MPVEQPLDVQVYYIEMVIPRRDRSRHGVEADALAVSRA